MNPDDRQPGWPQTCIIVYYGLKGTGRANGYGVGLRVGVVENPAATNPQDSICVENTYA